MVHGAGSLQQDKVGGEEKNWLWGQAETEAKRDRDREKIPVYRLKPKWVLANAVNWTSALLIQNSSHPPNGWGSTCAVLMADDQIPALNLNCCTAAQMTSVLRWPMARGWETVQWAPAFCCIPTRFHSSSRKLRSSHTRLCPAVQAAEVLAAPGATHLLCAQAAPEPTEGLCLGCLVCARLRAMFCVRVCFRKPRLSCGSRGFTPLPCWEWVGWALLPHFWSHRMGGGAPLIRHFLFCQSLWGGGSLIREELRVVPTQELRSGTHPPPPLRRPPPLGAQFSDCLPWKVTFGLPSAT